MKKHEKRDSELKYGIKKLDRGRFFTFSNVPAHIKGNPIHGYHRRKLFNLRAVSP